MFLDEDTVCFDFGGVQYVLGQACNIESGKGERAALLRCPVVCSVEVSSLWSWMWLDALLVQYVLDIDSELRQKVHC